MHHPHRTQLNRRLSRRVAVAAAGLSLLGHSRRAAQAQETGQVVASSEGSAPIISTRTGEVPSTGARRPGPFDQAPLQAVRPPGLTPVTLRVERAAIDAPIEPLLVVDGSMQDPTGPWAVAWYENLASLGEGGNVVMAGHIDYWNVGPAVFYSIDELVEGDEIDVVAEDGQTFTYAVEWVRQYDAENVPLDEVVGSTNGESLTLITCGGTFDYATAHYLQRTVVRANQVTG
jgi:LPXTG-site transpeptidase (sortase) family protein